MVVKPVIPLPCLLSDLTPRVPGAPEQFDPPAFEAALKETLWTVAGEQRNGCVVR